jgi:hypothetical protein
MKKNLVNLKLNWNTNAKMGHRWENGTKERQNVSFFFGQITIDFKMFNLPFFLEKAKMEIGQSSNF